MFNYFRKILTKYYFRWKYRTVPIILKTNWENIAIISHDLEELKKSMVTVLGVPKNLLGSPEGKERLGCKNILVDFQAPSGSIIFINTSPVIYKPFIPLQVKRANDPINTFTEGIK